MAIARIGDNDPTCAAPLAGTARRSRPGWVGANAEGPRERKGAATDAMPPRCERYSDDGVGPGAGAAGVAGAGSADVTLPFVPGRAPGSVQASWSVSTGHRSRCLAASFSM